MVVKYVGKCLWIESGKEKILAIGDVHIGYGRDEEAVGVMLNRSLFEDMIKDLDLVFSKIGKVSKIILLGDLKHSFSAPEKGERYDLVNLFDYLQRKAEEIIIIKGNHDTYILNVASGSGIKVFDYYIWKGYCFLHGDRDFKEIHDKKVMFWIMGHMHPAIKLKDGSKIEKYKCFLSGEYEKKEIIILPSLAEAGEGIDVRELDRELCWNFPLDKFEVHVVSSDLEVLNFGELRRIR